MKKGDRVICIKEFEYYTEMRMLADGAHIPRIDEEFTIEEALTVNGIVGLRFYEVYSGNGYDVDSFRKIEPKSSFISTETSKELAREAIIEITRPEVEPLKTIKNYV